MRAAEFCSGCWPGTDALETHMNAYEDDWRREVMEINDLKRALIREHQEKHELSERLKIATAQVNDLRNRIDCLKSYYKAKEDEFETAKAQRAESEKKVQNLVSQAASYFGTSFASYDSLSRYFAAHGSKASDVEAWRSRENEGAKNSTWPP